MATLYGDKWKIDSSLSEGGQARTFLVHDVSDDRGTQFVLKRIRNRSRLDRFRAEIEAARKLRHPNIVRYVDADLEAEKPYLVVEYYSGGPLSKATLPELDVIQRLSFFRIIVRAVEFAHANGVIHRDLKPDNIFLADDNETPVVGDFGICFIDEGGERFTLTDEAVGARKYTAPELEDGRARDVSRSTDVYSLGKILYWLFKGRVFDREKHRDPDWDLTNEGMDLLPFKLAELELVNELLDRAITVSVGDRFYNAKQLRANLDRTIWRVAKHCQPTNRSARMICSFCGLGEYKDIGDSDIRDGPYGYDEVERSGVRHLDQGKWLILWCNHCGHVQHFRRDILGTDLWARREGLSRAAEEFGTTAETGSRDEGLSSADRLALFATDIRDRVWGGGGDTIVNLREETSSSKPWRSESRENLAMKIEELAAGGTITIVEQTDAIIVLRPSLGEVKGHL